MSCGCGCKKNKNNIETLGDSYYTNAAKKNLRWK